MRIIPVGNDGVYCDGCGQTLAHGESALVPDRERAHEEPETLEAERVQDKAFALCLGCASNAADVLAAHGSEERQRAVYLALRDLRAALPMLTGRVVTPAEQIVLDAAASLISVLEKPSRKADHADRKEAEGAFAHSLRLARNRGWTP